MISLINDPDICDKGLGRLKIHHQRKIGTASDQNAVKYYADEMKREHDLPKYDQTNKTCVTKMSN